MNRNTSSFHTILACLCCQIVLKLRADARQCNKKHCTFVWLRGLSRKRNIFPSVFAPHKLSREDTGGGNRHCKRLFNYRRVKLDLTPEIEGFHMLFERCHTLNSKRSLKQHKNTSISGVKFRWTTLFMCRFPLSPPEHCLTLHAQVFEAKNA